MVIVEIASMHERCCFNAAGSHHVKLHIQGLARFVWLSITQLRFKSVPSGSAECDRYWKKGVIVAGYYLMYNLLYILMNVAMAPIQRDYWTLSLQTKY